jgi:flagellin-like protein
MMGEQELRNKDRAVSPVIGVILMVDITVILAAVIGTFVLGLGDSIESTPQASWDFESSEDGDGNINKIVITHNGGDTIDADRLNVTGAVDDGDGNAIQFTDGSFGSDDTVAAGDSLTIGSGGTGSISGSQGDTVRLIYDSPNSDQSSVLATFDLPADGADS